MKRLRWSPWWRTLLATALVSLLSASVQAQVGRGSKVAPLPMVAGELIVRLTPDFPECAHCLLAAGRGFTATTGRRVLDQVRHRYGIKAMEPVHGGVHGAARREAALRRFGRRDNGGAGAASTDLPDLSQTYLVRVDPRTDLSELASELQRDPVVEWVEPNYLYGVDSAPALPDDPFLHSSGSWGQSFPDLWGLFQIEAPAAWETSQGEGVIVAVVDSGLDVEHPDLAANVWQNPGEIPNNGIDDDGNGFVDDVNGWDFTRCVKTDVFYGICSQPKEPGPEVNDPVGHGTHVAGLIAAVQNNGIGIVGVAPRAKIMAARGLDRSGSGRNDDLAEALVYAAENGARVINASWSGPPSRTIEAAIEYVTSAFDVVVVASADNGGVPLERGVYPANLSGVIAVGATTEREQRAPFSNFGGPLDLTAPGGGGTEPAGIIRPNRSILSLLAPDSIFAILCMDQKEGGELCEDAPWVVDAEYVRQSGTSMSAAYVSGVAALVRSARPSFTRRQVRQALVATAADLGSPGWDQNFGYGRVNAAAAVEVEAIPVAQLTTPENRQKVWERNFPLTVRGTALGGDRPLRSWQLSIREENTAGPPVIVATGSGPVTDDALGSVTLDAPLRLVPGRRYVLELAVEDVDGNQAVDTTGFLVPNPRYAIVPIPDHFDEGGQDYTLSADGTRVAFVRADRDRHPGIPDTSLWFFDSVARELTLIAKGGVRPHLDPTGTYLIYGGYIPGTREGGNMLFNLEERRFDVLPPGLRVGPLSAGAGRMAFGSTDDPFGANVDRSQELFLFDLPDGPLRQVTNVEAPSGGIYFGIRLAMSAEGHRVLFYSFSAFDPRFSSGGLFLYDDDTGDSRLLTGRPGFPADAGYPSMDLAGRRVVFEFDGLHLIDLDADTSEVLLVRSTIGEPFGGTDAHISGDGTKVVFNAVADFDPAVGDEDLGGEVFVLDLATREISQVTDRGPVLGIAAINAVAATSDTIVLHPYGILNGLDVSPLSSRAVRRKRATNEAPRLSVPGVVRIPEGRRTSILLRSIDSDGDQSTLFAQRVPPFVNAPLPRRLRDLASSELLDHGDGSGELSFTPRYTEAGSYPLRLAAFDDEGGVDVVDVTLVIEDTQKEGDGDCDGVVDLADLGALIHAVFDPMQVATCPTSDADGDGFVKANDITALVQQLTPID